MAKLKLTPIGEKPTKEQKVSLTLDPNLAYQVKLYSQAYAAENNGQEPQPEELLTAIIAQFIATDPAFRAFEKERTSPGRRRRAPSGATQATQNAPESVSARDKGAS